MNNNNNNNNNYYNNKKKTSVYNPRSHEYDEENRGGPG